MAAISSSGRIVFIVCVFRNVAVPDVRSQDPSNRMTMRESFRGSAPTAASIQPRRDRISALPPARIGVSRQPCARNTPKGVPLPIDASGLPTENPHRETRAGHDRDNAIVMRPMTSCLGLGPDLAAEFRSMSRFGSLKHYYKGRGPTESEMRLNKTSFGRCRAVPRGHGLKSKVRMRAWQALRTGLSLRS